MFQFRISFVCCLTELILILTKKVFLKYKIQFNDGIFWYFIYSMFQNKYEMDFGFNGYVSLIRKPPSHSSNKSWLSEAILPKL